MKVHAIGHMHPNLLGGVVVHASNFFNALEKRIPLTRSIIVPNTNIGPNTTSETTTYDADVHINLTLKEYWKLLNDPRFQGKKIAYPVFEWTYTEDFPTLFGQHDQLWVTTHWHKSIIEKSGYDSNKIKVIPEGINPNVFNPTIKPNRTSAKIEKFKFLCIARPDVRKNIPIIIEAFIEEFSNENDVILVFEHIIPNVKAATHPNIVYVSPTVNHGSLAPLYTSCDAFVLPSKTEGWGLPICEAMSCGLPVITTNYSGMTEYCNEDNAYFVNHTLEEMPTNWNGIKNPGVWANIEKEHLKHLMRYVYTHREEAKEKGAKASRYILENFTWELSAQKAEHALNELIHPI